MLATIIIRTYNSEQWIERAVKSALAQTPPSGQFEVVVVNDGSTDGTSAILETFGSRIRCIVTKNSGAVKAANTGLRAAYGEYVSCLDADDEYSEEFLQKMISAIKQSSADFAYCDYWEIAADGSRKLVSLADNLFNTIFCNILFKKKSLTEAGLLNEDLIFPEYDLLLKTSSNWKGVHIPEPLYVYYRHKGTITASSQRVQRGIEQLSALYPDKLDVIAKIRRY